MDEVIPDWAGVDDEDLLTKKQTMGVAEKVAAEAVRKALQQREYEQAPKLIEDEMKDYSRVVTPENVLSSSSFCPPVVARTVNFAPVDAPPTPKFPAKKTLPFRGELKVN